MSIGREDYQDQARSLVEQLGAMQVEARAFDFPCPRCGENRMNPIAVRNSLSRYAKVYICNQCGMDEAMRDMVGQPPLPLNQWGMVKAFAPEVALPEETSNEAGALQELNRYFYTFGSDPAFPYQCGWVEVHAASWEEAHKKFRARFPDRHENTLNCAFFYDQDRWAQMDPENTWHGWKCFEIIE